MTQPSGNPLADCLAFIKELDDRDIHRTLACFREDAIMVEIAIPGERWEVEFFADGDVMLEIFGSKSIDATGDDARAEMARLLREDDEAEADEEVASEG